MEIRYKWKQWKYRTFFLILIGYCFKINLFLKIFLFWHQSYMGLIIHTTSFRTSKIIVTLIYVCLHEVGRKTGILQNVICRTETIDDDAAQQSPPLKNWPQAADRPTVVPKRLKPVKNKLSWYDFTNFFQASFSRLTSASYYCRNYIKSLLKFGR